MRVTIADRRQTMIARLADRVAIVTGAGQGIGKAIALRLADEGAHVMAVDQDGPLAAAVAGQVTDKGRQGHEMALDVSDVEQVAAAVDRTMRIHGKVDILVNSAGIVRIEPFLEVTEQEWDRVMNVNLKGTFFFSQAAGKQMALQGSGSIINMSSISGRGGRDDSAPYAASKAGVISVTQSAALALAGSQVRVNAICPGVIDTSMVRAIDSQRAQFEELNPGEALTRLVNRIPLGRMGQVEDVARIAAFLASDEAGYITGQTINVCGGLEMD